MVIHKRDVPQVGLIATKKTDFVCLVCYRKFKSAAGLPSSQRTRKKEAKEDDGESGDNGDGKRGWSN